MLNSFVNVEIVIFSAYSSKEFMWKTGSSLSHIPPVKIPLQCAPQSSVEAFAWFSKCGSWSLKLFPFNTLRFSIHQSSSVLANCVSSLVLGKSFANLILIFAIPANTCTESVREVLPVLLVKGDNFQNFKSALWEFWYNSWEYFITFWIISSVSEMVICKVYIIKPKIISVAKVRVLTSSGLSQKPNSKDKF